MTATDKIRRRIKAAPVGASLAGLLLLAGCAAPGAGQCDPTRTTFFDGIGCAAGGGYQQRQQILGNAEADAKARAAAANQDAANAQQRADQAKADQAAAQARVAQQDRDLAAMRTQLDRLRTQRAGDPRVAAAAAAVADADRLRQTAAATPADLAARDAALARARSNLQALSGI